MTPDVRLDHCVVHVSDWERSNAFYRDVLGAEFGAGRSRAVVPVR
jgi:catechol 2,3-dioxygenase-like lactoylglutathione lyase family enzyme